MLAILVEMDTTIIFLNGECNGHIQHINLCFEL